MILNRLILVVSLLLAFGWADASDSKRIRSVKKFSSSGRRYMFECATSYEEKKQPLTVHAEYFKKCNSVKNHGPICRLELQDGKYTQLEQFIDELQKDVRLGVVSGQYKHNRCPENMGITREVMDSNGCTARVSLCYPAKYVQNNKSKSQKSDRMPASVSKPKKIKRTTVNF